MHDISIHFLNLKIWFAALILLALILFIVAFKARRQDLNRDFYILAILRGAVLMLALFLFAQPVLQWTQRREYKPEFLVWLDNSLSMKHQRDFSPDTLLAGLRGFERALGQRDITLRYLLVGDSARAIRNPQNGLTFSDGSTDIVAAFQTAQTGEEHNFRGALLVSDGVVTRGEDPRFMAPDVGFPVFTLGIGDSLQPLDPSIAGITLPTSARLDDTLNISVEFVPLGNGQPLEISLYEGEKLIDKRIVKTQAEYFRQEMKFRTIPERTGRRKYSVLLKAEDDPNIYNNKQAGIIRVTEQRKRIVIISGQAGFEAQILAEVLAQLDDTDVLQYSETPSGMIPRSFSATIAQKWDCAVLVNYPTQESGRSDFAAVRSKLTAEKVPLFVFPGSRTAADKLSDLLGQRAVEFEINPESKSSVLVQFEESSRNHPAVRSRFYRGEEFSLWNNLPPVGWPYRRFALRTQLLTLVKAATLQEQPVLAVGELAQCRVAFCFGQDVWRWYFMTRESDLAPIYPALMQGTALWLSDTLATSNILLETAKEVYLVGESAAIRTRVFDLQGNFLQDAAVQIMAKRAADGTEIPLKANRLEDYYEAELPLRTGGNYIIRAEVKLGDNVLGDREIRIEVLDQPVELLTVMQRADVLRVISQKTGGKKLGLTDLEALARMIPSESKIVEFRRELKLWRFFGILLILIILLALEWTYRRMRGYQ